MRVLVLDAQAKQALPVVRDLRAAGHVVVGASPWPWLAAACWSWGVHRAIIVESSSRSFLSQLAVIIGSYEIDVVLPLKDETTRVVAENIEAIRPARTCVASADIVNRAGHKAEVMTLVNNTGLSAPRTLSCSTASEIGSVVEAATFPAVVKAAHGSGIVWYANTATELQAVLTGWIPVHGEIVVQEFIRGEGVGCFALYDSGSCVSAYTHRRCREYPATGGISLSAESTDDPDLMCAGLALLDRLGWHGPAMVECKREADTGRLVLIEVNTKFWGSLDLALACGLTFPRWAVAIASGEEVPPHMKYPAGVHLYWPAPSGLAQALTSGTAAHGLWRDLTDPNARSDWRLSDPMPHVLQVCQTFGLLWRTRGRWAAPHGHVAEAV